VKHLSLCQDSKSRKIEVRGQVRQAGLTVVTLLQASVDQLSQALAQSEGVLDRRTCPLLAEVVHHLLQVADQNHNKYRGNGLVYREAEELDSDKVEFLMSSEDETDEMEACLASEAVCSSQACSLLLMATFVAGLILAFLLPQEEPPLFF